MVWILALFAWLCDLGLVIVEFGYFEFGRVFIVLMILLDLFGFKFGDLFTIVD